MVEKWNEINTKISNGIIIIKLEIFFFFLLIAILLYQSGKCKIPWINEGGIILMES